MHAVKPLYIIVIAYVQFARDLLEELRERGKDVSGAQGAKMSDYTFVFSDACMTAAKDLMSFGSKIFITSPVQTLTCGSDLQKILEAEVKKKDRTLTEEPYTFDAVLILASAVTSCAKEDEVSRKCVSKYLQVQHDLSGACQRYDFHQGETHNAPYSVYAGCNSTFQSVGTITEDKPEIRLDQIKCQTTGKNLK